MEKILVRVLGLLSSLLIFSSEAKAKNISGINDTHPDTKTNPRIYEIKLIPKPRPLILKQTDYAFDETFAAHRSHSSHRSHASHVSHRSSSYSAPSEEPATPLSPVTPEKSPSVSEKRPSSSTPLHQPSKPSSKKWQTTTEWKENTCKLYHHDVLITLKNSNVLEGMVTECKGNSIEVTESGSTEERKHWIDLKDIDNLLWQ